MRKLSEQTNSQTNPSIQVWVRNEFSGLDLGDSRLNDRFLKIQTSLKWVNLDKKNPKANSLTIARHLPDVIRKLLVIKEAIIEWGNQPAIVGELNLDFSLTENCGFSEVWT